jgi:excisionase family DNA binding protein
MHLGPAEPMSELARRLQAMVDAADPEGLVTFRVAWLAGLLTAERPVVQTRDPDLTIDLTVTEVAKLFGRGESTVRTWIAAGEFPNAYKLHQREWRVPRTDVLTLQLRHQRAEHSTEAVIEDVNELGAWRKHRIGG